MKVWFVGGPLDGREYEVEEPLPSSVMAVDSGPPFWGVREVEVRVAEYACQQVRRGGSVLYRYSFSRWWTTKAKTPKNLLVAVPRS